ncbi:aspartate dehydrogenase [Marinitoga hydrogenitolerans DSM 16785]|uniref:L-aspartate dehydrogenase n=1 Tax=Marinitoga hydrogenitolerans (strain DSM 16785 / JCM 12826 / AT1271) TaxID=1122195 RepID=A0A1M4YJP5_MARH1|nr:aspartate dehydrogenase [Marinitoga hydrogenitolerans]SHF05712.1 aspartate dehydrogenase [Marinitoga hydrogenitolerans DSM 16785]
MKLFFLGAGNSAKIILEELENSIEKAYFFDKDKEKIEILKKRFENIDYADIEDLNNLNVDFVIEVASVEALEEYGIKILEMNKNLVILSTGAFADKIFRYKFVKKLNNSNSKVYIASGAVGGIDLINAVHNKLNKITLTTRKPPKSFGLDIDKEKIIFEGNSIEAIKQFPKNVNVAVTLSLAARDFEKVNVRIIADPNVERNIHIVEINSKVGNYKFKFENFPSKNPKTSYLAPLSIVSLLKNTYSNFKIGG